MLLLANRELLATVHAWGDVYVFPLLWLWVGAKSICCFEEECHAFEQDVHCYCRKTTIMVAVRTSACVFPVPCVHAIDPCY